MTEEGLWCPALSGGSYVGLNLRMLDSISVIPAKAGIQRPSLPPPYLDPDFRRDDGIGCLCLKVTTGHFHVPL